MNLSERRFLVVDDYPELGDLICMLLSNLGYPYADKVVDGVGALERLHAFRYDFVISDINMPRMNGFQLLRAIKSDESLRYLPVLIVSANASRESINMALRLGAIDCLMKPVAEKALKEIVQKVWANPARPAAA